MGACEFEASLGFVAISRSAKVRPCLKNKQHSKLYKHTDQSEATSSTECEFSL